MTTKPGSSAPLATNSSSELQRRQLSITGVVQGVGFRPYVYRLATLHGLSGWIANDGLGVSIEVEGEASRIAAFVDALPQAAPAACRIDSCESVALNIGTASPNRAEASFSIRSSREGAQPALSIALDTVPCETCIQEFDDQNSRRYHYPFISCPDCGPRWTILKKLPFDRHHTSFAAFPPCSQCNAEYHTASDRRFHHQSISCPECGPSLFLKNSAGKTVATAEAAVAAAVDALEKGLIVAIKSTGGFQLLVDALNPTAVERLRQRKQRPAKPLAVMFASPAQLEEYCTAQPQELDAAQSPARPIVLLPQRGKLPEAVAPGLPSVGAMLSPSALHQALFSQWPTPLVATSGNLSGEPLCADNDQATERLGDIADYLLMHDLTITQPLDDSVVRLIAGHITPLRCGRGLAPLQLPLADIGQGARLALGGHGKNTVAVTTPTGILSSPYIGDLDSSLAIERFAQTVQQLQTFATAPLSSISCDAHPDYASTQWGYAHYGSTHYGSTHYGSTHYGSTHYGSTHNAATSIVPSQHHIAHFFSVMAEQQYRGPALGVSWDGSGWGADGSSWGGEFFLWDGGIRVERVARLKHFPLPGGEAAVREPRRQLLAALYAMGAEAPPGLREAFSNSEWHNLQRMLQNNIHTPLTSSAGRLIDAIAALLAGVHFNRFEADAAMQLEALAVRAAESTTTLPFSVYEDSDCKVIDWQPMLKQLLGSAGAPTTALATAPALAAAALRTLAAMIDSIARLYPDMPIFLSGGVFQNRLLVEDTLQRLQQAGRKVYTHRQLPANDGGLAVGQLYHRLCTGDSDHI